MAFNLVSAEQIKAINLDNPDLPDLPEDGGSGMTIKVDTAANLKKENPILLKGQLGAESDTTYMKLGDGKAAWNDLGYIVSNTATTATKTLQDDNGKVIADTYLKKSGGTMTGDLIFKEGQCLSSENGNSVISLFNGGEIGVIIGAKNNAPIYFVGDNGRYTYIDTKTGAYHGDVVGTATKATQDTNGNAIVGTYATKTELSGKQDKFIFDTTPTANSTNPVTSDGVKKYVDSAIDALDSVLTTTLNADDKSY